MIPYMHPIPALPGSTSLELTTNLSWLLFALTIAVTVFTVGTLNVWAYRVRKSLPARAEGIFAKRFFCPLKATPVEVDFLAQVRDPHVLLKVERCSAFPPGSEIDCHHACLHLAEAQAAPVLVAPPYYCRLPLL